MRKKLMTWVLCIALVVTMMPQAFLAETAHALTNSAVIEFDSTSSGGNFGEKMEVGNVWYWDLSANTTVTLNNIGCRSTNPKVVASESMWVRFVEGVGCNSLEALFIGEGETTLELFDKNNPQQTLASKTITVAKSSPCTLYRGAENGLREKNYSFPFTLIATPEDETLVSMDGDYAIGKKVGNTKIHVTCDKIPEIDYTYDVNVVESETGIYYKDEKTTELERSNNDSFNVTVKNTDARTFGSKSTKTITDTCYTLLSNTDVAEIEPVETVTDLQGNITSVKGIKSIKPKKNGTATIYVYPDSNKKRLIGTLKLRVTGCGETSDPENGWKGLDSPQGEQGTIKMSNYPVEYQSFNEAEGENQITQFLQANSIEFSFDLTAAGKGSDIDNSTLEFWKNKNLPYINIYERQADGSLGSVVASYKNGGYTIKSILPDSKNPDTTVESSNKSMAIAVKPGVLKKGTDYVLRAEPEFNSWLNGGKSPISGYLRIPISWGFTTTAPAKSVTLDKTQLELKPGDSATLTAEMNKGQEVEADDTIIWTSADDTIAEVDNNGKVTAKKAGTTTIVATAMDGKVEAVCKVTVSETAAPPTAGGNDTKDNEAPADNTPAPTAPAKNAVIKDEKTGVSYKVTGTGKSGGTVTYVKPKKTGKTISVPKTVEIDGITYKVTKIENKAFKNNKTVTKVTIGSNVTTVGAEAFAGCKKLKTVTVGSNVTTIGNKAFAKNTALKKVAIPAKVKIIGKQAFSGCKNLKTITIKTTKLTKKNVGSKAFSGVSSKAIVKVPAKKVNSYKKLLRTKGLSKKARVRK